MKKLAIVVVLVLTACTQSEPDGEPAASPSENPAAASAVLLGEDELGPTLLTLDDMPTGWTIAPDKEIDDVDLDDNETLHRCSSAFGTGEGMLAEAGTGFARGDAYELFQWLSSFRSEEAAEDEFDVIRRTMLGCSEWEENDEEMSASFRMELVSFPKLGDQIVAMRVTGELIFAEDPELPIAMAGDLILIRQGNLLTGLDHIGFSPFYAPPIDSAETQSVAEAALAKVKKTLAPPAV